VTGANRDHVRTLHDTILAYVFDDLDNAGIPFKGGRGKYTKNTFGHCIHQNLISADDERHIQGILPDLMLDCSLLPGQPSNSLDGYRHLGELKTLSQRNMSVGKRAEHIKRDLEQNAKNLGAVDPRSTVLAEMMSYGIGGQYTAMVVCRFGEFSKDFSKLRDYIARQRAYAYNEHFNSSVNRAMLMFKLSITSRWALMAARGWARVILDRRRDLINDRPNRATATEAPLDGAQERYHSDNHTTHARGAYHHGEAA
jgi:hypothetical protein